jgi:hypothetical protein
VPSLSFFRRGPVLSLLLTGAAVGAVLATFSNLYDGDSYFHLAVAREYAAGALRGGLRWARFSAFAEGFGDKELLFHLFLLPFVCAGGGVGAGLAALAVLNGLAAAVVGAAARRDVGSWAALVFPVLLLASADFAARLLRLRPEILSLIFVVTALVLAARRRHRLLAVVAFLFTLSHTSFPLLLVLCSLWLVNDGLRRGEWAFELLAYPMLGTGLGLVLHPQFPANVRVWYLQNVARYQVALPDAGAEFLPSSIRDVVELNAAWGVLLLLLWASRVPRLEAAQPEDARRADYARIAAWVSAALFVLLSRFAVYLMPLGTLAFLYALRVGGWRLSGRVRLPFGRSAPLAAAAVLLAGPLVAWNVLILRGALTTQGVFLTGRDRDTREMSRQIPPEAKVAAPWGDAQLYAYWAPQGRYLNVLDPIFMAAWRPRAYRAQLALFRGEDPDVPLTAATELDSDFIALTRRGNTGPVPRLLRDPRVRLLHAGFESLYVLLPAENGAFVLDWRVSPAGGLPAGATELASWPQYPRAQSERGRAFEGFVDGRRTGRDGCQVFSRVQVVERSAVVDYELAAYGPASLVLDGRLVAAVLGEPGAVLGEGTVLRLTLGPGLHVVSVETCPARGITGFYLLARASPGA